MNQTGQHNTIFALASAPGKAGVAVVRVSGPKAHDSLKNMTEKHDFTIRYASVIKIIHPVSRETIDHGLILKFDTPHSFTGENVVEYHLHGGVAVVQSLLAALAAQNGHRLAQPGEFTRRAFENGKMDLTAAEAVADLIDAETESQKQQALNQMGGALQRLYDGWADRLKRTLAHLEADIDFPDEDLPDGVAAQVRPEIDNIINEISAHLDDNRRGEILRDGIHIVLIGAPNAGKSSLLNALARRDVAIVSAQAGTTRDIVEAHLNIGGFPVILSDTAGLRPDQLGDKGHDAIESEGIRRALQRAEQADLKILLFDAENLPAIDPHTAALIDDNSLIIFNKCENSTPPENIENRKSIPISVTTGQGLDALIGHIADRLKDMMGQAKGRETPSLTRQRHRESLEKSRDSLARATQAAMPELMAEDVRLAVRHLGHITGRIDVEDLLDVIFKDFCIGK